MSNFSRLSLYARWRARALALGTIASIAFSAGCSRQTEEAQSRSESVVSTTSITQGADEMRSAWYENQPLLSPARVSTFQMLFNTSLSGQQDIANKIIAQPLVVGNNVLVVTEANNIYLVDGTTGAVLKNRTIAGGTFDPRPLPCADVMPTIGVTGTPVINRATGIAYFYSKNTAGAYSLHAIDTSATGTLAEQNGFPVTIGGAAQNDPAVTFDGKYQLQRPGLLFLNNVVYAAFGAHCDQGAYRGWVFGVNTAGAVTARFTTQTGAAAHPGNGNGIWMSGAGLASDGNKGIFFVTGNGDGTEPGAIASNAPPGNLVEAVVRVDVQGDGSLKAMDFFSPWNGYHMGDEDLSGGGVALLPSQFGTPSVPNTAVAVGKEGTLYLMDRSKLGGFKMGANGLDAVLSEIPIKGSLRSHVAVWPGDGGYLYIDATGAEKGSGLGNRLRAFKFAPTAQGVPAFSLVGVAGPGDGDNFGVYSGSPIVTSDNLATGSAVVWCTNAVGGVLRAYEALPVNGNMKKLLELTYFDHAEFTKPAVGNGRVYVGTENGRLLGFGAPLPPIVASSVQFGTVTVGQTPPKTLNATISAATGQTVTVSALASSDNVIFTKGTSTPALPVTLTGAQTLTVPITFNPAANTTYSGVLNVTTDKGAGTVSLSGTGQTLAPHLTATPATVAFNSVAPGTTTTINVNVQNTGSQTLTFGATTAPAAPFAVTGPPANGQTLTAGAQTSVAVSFAPTALGNYNGNLVLNSNGGNVTIPLSGTASPPALMVITPLSLDFGSIAAGTTKALNFTIKNTGGLTLVIQKAKPPVASQFVAQTVLAEGSSVAPGQTVTETVALSSTTAGTFNDVWTITGSDTSGQQNVAFTGTVTAPLNPLPRTGWVASASATGGADVPANAIDASTATRFTTGIPQSAATTQSFTVDMLSPQTISQISLDSGGDFARSYQVFTSTDGVNFGTPVATGTGTQGVTAVPFTQTTARYVRVTQLTSAGQGAWWSINDFNVYGSSSTQTGAALARTGWTGTATATAGADVVANAIDANTGSRWSSGVAQSGGAQSYTLDMASAQTFAQISIESGGDYARSYQVFSSTDGVNFGTAFVTGTGTQAVTTFTFAQRTARYLKITQLTSAATAAWWSIYDLNVYSPGTLAALSRAGWVASGSATGDPPANAIDNAPATRWSSTAAQVPGP